MISIYSQSIHRITIKSGGRIMNSTNHCVVKYMKDRQWQTDQKSERKRYMCRLAQQSKRDPDIASKIGGMLIYNQVIEQYLSDIITMSIYYIKAKIWPVAVSLEIDLDKATFGKMIDYFKLYATVEPNREQILSYLTKFNIKRNIVVHDLFDINDLKKLAIELNEYAELADEIISLLSEYDKQVCENFCELDRSKTFSNP